MPKSPQSSAGKALKKFLVGLVVLLVVLVVAAFLLVPPIASRYLAGAWPVELPSGKGEATLSDVSIGWGGPQRVGKIVLKDASGKQMADLAVEARSSLLGLAMGGGNLGTILLSGTVDVTEEQLAAPVGAPSKPSTPPTATTGGAPTGTKIPKNLQATIEAKPITITYTPRAGSGLKPVTISGLELVASLQGAGIATIDLSAKSPTIAVKGSARNFVDGSGRLALAGAEGDLSAAIQAPGELIEALARVALNQAAAAGSTSTGSAPTELAANLRIAAGRLQLADATKPLTLKGPVPQAVIEMLAGRGASIRLDSAPSLTHTITTLNLPLPDANGNVNLRGGAIRASLVTTAIAGAISVGEGSAKSFRVEPVTVDLSSDDFAGALSLTARTRGSFDGREAGSLDLDAQVQGLLDSSGMVRKGVPGPVHAELKLQNVPTSLADGLVRQLGINLNDTIGPSATATVTIVSSEASSTAVPSLLVNAVVDAAHLDARLALDMNEKEARLTGEGLSIEATRLAPLLRALTKEQGYEFTGDGRATITMKNASAPMMSGGLPDLGRAVAAIDVLISGLTVERGLGDRPLEARSLETHIALAGDAPPKITMSHQLASGGRPFTVNGDAALAGLITKRDQGWPFLDITPAQMRPSGTIDVAGLPSDLLGYVPAEMRDAATRALGPDLNIHMQGARDPAGKTDLTLALKGQGMDAAGAFILDDTSIRTTADGFRATINQPGPLAQSFLQSQPDSPVAGVQWDQPLTLALSTFSATLPKAGEPFAMDQVEAAMRLQSAGIGIDARAPQSGRIERLTVETLDATVTLTKAQGASIKLDSRGSHAGEAFTIAGDLTLGKILGVKGLELGALAPKGKIDARGVPTALAAIFDTKNGPIIREAAGPRIDLTITAPSGESAAGPRSASLALKGSNLDATSSFALADRTLTLGQTTVALTLTPALVDAALAQYAAELQPKTALAANARVNLAVFPTAVDLDARNAPDLKTLRPVRAMLTSPDDIVLMNLPGGGEGAKSINAGLRGLEAGLTWVEQDIMKREASLKAQLFEPSEPAAVLASIDATGILANPPPTFDIKINSIDTARADRMLGRPGLLADLVGESAGVGLVGRARAGVQDVDLILKSPRLDTSLSLQRTRDVIRLTAPGAAELNVPAAWANRYLLAPGPDGRPASIQFADAAKISLRLNQLAFAPGDAPLKPGVFALDAKASAPSLSLLTADGQQVNIQSLSASIKNNDAARAIAFDLTTQQVGIGRAGAANPVRAVGTITGLADESGKLDRAHAALTAQVTGTLPTAVIDAFANQKGALVDLLGATTTLDLNAQNLSQNSGQLRADMKADNAVATASGSVAAGRFSADKPVNITLTRITPELSARYLESIIPIISKVEKTPTDEPAVITANSLTLPTDGDTRKINGEIRVDPGTLQFETSDFFGEIVKVTGGKAKGQVGKRVKPFDFVANEGVVSYERIELPLGEFAIETRGKVDLNTNRIDIVTFVPFYAVAEEIAGALANIPGIQKLTQIPIRTHGPLDNPKSEVQLDLLVTESVPEAIDDLIPEDIKKVIPPEIGDALKDLLKPKKDKKKP